LPRSVASLSGSKSNCTLYRSYGNTLRQLCLNKQPSGGPSQSLDGSANQPLAPVAFRRTLARLSCDSSEHSLETWISEFNCKQQTSYTDPITTLNVRPYSDQPSQDLTGPTPSPPLPRPETPTQGYHPETGCRGGDQPSGSRAPLQLPTAPNSPAPSSATSSPGGRHLSPTPPITPPHPPP